MKVLRDLTQSSSQRDSTQILMQLCNCLENCSRGGLNPSGAISAIQSGDATCKDPIAFLSRIANLMEDHSPDSTAFLVHHTIDMGAGSVVMRDVHCRGQCCHPACLRIVFDKFMKEIYYHIHLDAVDHSPVLLIEKLRMCASAKKVEGHTCPGCKSNDISEQHKTQYVF